MINSRNPRAICSSQHRGKGGGSLRAYENTDYYGIKGQRQQRRRKSIVGRRNNWAGVLASQIILLNADQIQLAGKTILHQLKQTRSQDPQQQPRNLPQRQTQPSDATEKANAAKPQPRQRSKRRNCKGERSEGRQRRRQQQQATQLQRRTQRRQRRRQQRQASATNWRPSSAMLHTTQWCRRPATGKPIIDGGLFKNGFN